MGEKQAREIIWLVTRRWDVSVNQLLAADADWLLRMLDELPVPGVSWPDLAAACLTAEKLRGRWR